MNLDCLRVNKNQQLYKELRGKLLDDNSSDNL